MSIFKNSIIPVYYQIKEDILEKIEAGEWRIGDRIPSEIELCKIYGVSRGTLRQSLLELRNKGFLYRERGKGTFVRSNKSTYNIQNIFSFTELVKAKGGTPTTKVIDKVVEEGNRIINSQLKLDPKDKVIKVVRLRLAGNEPLMVEDNFLPYSLFPDLLNSDLTDVSFYHLLLEKYNVRLTKFYTLFEPVLSSEREVNYLKIKKGSPSLLIESIYFLKNDVPVLLGKGIMRGDRCRYFFKREDTPPII